MVARDLMQTRVVKCRADDSAADVCDLFQQEHVHGAPVVDDNDNLVGMISQEDLLIGSMTWSAERAEREEIDDEALSRTRVRDIMTSPAISATEETTVQDISMMMWRFRIHHIPIVRGGRVTGMVSSLDVCRAMAYGEVG